MGWFAASNPHPAASPVFPPPLRGITGMSNEDPGAEGGNFAEFPQSFGTPPAYENQAVPPEQYGDAPTQYWAPGQYEAPGQQFPPPGQQYGNGSGAPGYGPGYGTAGYGTAGYGAPGQYGAPPPAYRAWTIIAAIAGLLFSTIFGLPAALIASRYGRRVRTHWEAGDQQGAARASRTARTWAIVSTVLDALGLIVVLLIVVAGASSTSSQSTFHNPAVVAASIKSLLQKRISDPSSPYYSPGLKVTSVVCKSAGTNTDTCVDHFSDGQTSSETAVISADGQHFVTR